ncbi:MAG: bifunctional (p)ppGpp synthetase/guanosine-3',5'-bis(diphosphate) 3'-pyrophosphohydrolase [Clostridia bacterium]|nr:bifunctional (p)ppGpp synthetase/guanosine-3',5'-bis(diphosphate) 3'-pyrophosphohydrolase [Clostridia bacterium]
MSEKKLQLALALASYAHEGQADKAGKPYITHPLAVSEMVEGEDRKIVALLHDVLEDTFVTEATLRNLFGDEITDAVCAVSRNENESYEEFIVRAGQNELARAVKLADLKHNMDVSRLPEITERDLQRLEKYKKAYQYLVSGNESL